MHVTFVGYSWNREYSWNIISEYSAELHIEFFPNILGIPQGNVPRIYLQGNLNHLTVRKNKSMHFVKGRQKNSYSSNHLQINTLYVGKYIVKNLLNL